MIVVFVQKAKTGMQQFAAAVGNQICVYTWDRLALYAPKNAALTYVAKRLVSRRCLHNDRESAYVAIQLEIMLLVLAVPLFGFLGLVSGVATWTASTNAPSANWRGLAMSASGQYVTASQNNGQIYYSSDYGASFTASSAAARQYIYMAGSDSGQYLIVSAFGDQVYYSSDYGHTWSASNTPSSNWHGAAITGNGQYALACVYGGQIWKSSDRGQTFTVSSSISTNWVDVALDSTGQYAAAHSSSVVYYSADYGQTWASSGLQAGTSAKLIMSSSGVALCTSGITNAIYRSTNYGQTFTQLTSAPSGPYYGAACDSTCTKIVAGGNPGSLYMSFDAGETWAVTNSASRQWHIADMSADGMHVIAGDNSPGILYYSSNVFPADPTSQPSRQPSSHPSQQPAAHPSAQPSVQPSSQPTSQPTARPSAQPLTSPSSQPSAQPSSVPSSVAVFKAHLSKSYHVHNGFSFAALTSTGAVLYWAGDGTSDVQSIVTSGATAAAVNRAAVAAVTSTGHVEASGVAAYARGADVYQSGATALISIVGNEGAFAGITTAGAAIAFGGIGNGNDVSVSGFAAQLASGVVAIIASAASFTALKADGTVFTWGSKYCGGGVSSLTRTELQGIVKVFATRTAFAGLTSAGRVLAWGDLHSGGDISAVTADLQDDVFHIVSTQSAFVAFKPSGQLVVWGNPWFGADTTAVAAQIASEVKFVAHTSSAFAALKTDGSVVTWGSDQSGGESTAVQSALVSVTTIVSNMYAFAAITEAGAVVAWGNAPEGGEIAVNLAASLSVGVTEVFSTNRAFAALKDATGELVLWGNPYHGGDAGAAAAYLTSGVRTVCGNDAAFTAILQDGRGVAWGHSSSVAQPGLLSAGSAQFDAVSGCI